jgi:2-methylcitrate dehydratase PrpD
MAVPLPKLDVSVLASMPISQELAAFASSFDYEAIPGAMRARAKHLALDAVGIALASTQFDFAHRTLSALADLGGDGARAVLGFSSRLPLRDAVLMNALLVHGLDYDDTHVPGIIHTSASSLPLALGVAAHLDRSGRELLAAYVLATEISARLGSVAKGAFHQTGFHPTGLIGTFGCILAAGFLFGMNAAQLKMAQGIGLSLTSGSLEFLEDGAWTKRIHPGWAGVAGITAASLARRGFVGPSAAYEGRFGVFPSYLGARASECDYSLATRGLGKIWEMENVAVKPYPACHFVHACTDAAIALRSQGIRAGEIVHVRALVPQGVVKTVCEPVANKRRPANSYDAKFSIPYAVATALVRGRFGLAELEEPALRDAQVLALADKVDYEADPNSGFPKWYSGEVVIRLRDGRELAQREQINRGAADRPLANEEIIAKFMENAQLAVSPARAAEMRDAILSMDGRAVRARELEAVLGT